MWECSWWKQWLETFSFGFYQCPSLVEHHTRKIVNATGSFSTDVFREIQELISDIEQKYDATTVGMRSAENTLRDRCTTYASHRHDFIASRNGSKHTPSDQCRIIQSAMREDLGQYPHTLQGCYEKNTENYENFLVTDPKTIPCKEREDSLLCSAFMREARVRMKYDTLAEDTCVKPGNFSFTVDML